MIQVNLLPDVKLQYLKARRLQRTVILISVIVVAVSLVLFTILFLTVNVWQKSRINSISDDINTVSAEIQNTPELNRILTVQNQLVSLSGLHDEKPATKRLFGYLARVTPQSVRISKVNIDHETNAIIINGSTDNLQSVNKFVDTLKFTKYRLNPDEEAELSNAFSNVVMKNFGRDKKGANYTLELEYDPAIFVNTESKLALVVPKITTTRSVTELPQLGGQIDSGDPGNPLFERRDDLDEEGEL